jgi:DNA polymerase III delta subunit
MSKRGTSPGAAYLVIGNDEVLIANEVRDLLGDLLGDRDASLVVEEMSVEDLDNGDPRPIIDAFMTPPFLVDRRIVVARKAGKLTADASKQIAAALADPNPGAILVLAGDGGTPTPTLRKAVKAVGEELQVGTKSFGEKKSYVAEHLKAAPVRLNAAASKVLTEHLGEDLGRLSGILDTLASAYGTDVSIDPSMLAPYLGHQGQVPIWDLTDAVESGNAAKALSVLGRMMGPGGMSAHVITASFDSRFSKLAQLDGLDLRSSDDVAAAIGGSPFVAKKLFTLSSRLTHDAVVRALDLIGEADLALKGGSGLEEQMVAEILVARLAHLCASGR